MGDRKSTQNVLSLPCEARPLRHSVTMVALVCIGFVLCGPVGAQQDKAVWQSIFHTADGQPVRSPHFIEMLNDLLKNPEKGVTVRIDFPQ